MLKHLQIVINGKVENKGFRFYALRGAKMMNITGEISQKNYQVIIEAEGEDEPLRSFEKWCAAGPDGCEITGIDITELPMRGYDCFRIL